MKSVKIFFSWINVFKNTFFSISTPENVYLDNKYFDLRWIRSWDIDTYSEMADSEITGHFFDGPIAKNILKGVLLQHVKFHAFIIKWTIPSYITTSQPN